MSTSAHPDADTAQRPAWEPGAATPARRGRPTQPERRAETEGRVKHAAIELIAERGSRSVSLADIGQHAGFSRGIVTHMFGTKTRLLAALVQDIQSTVDTVVASGNPKGGTGLDTIVAATTTYLKYLAEHPTSGHAFLILWTEAAAGDPDLHQLFVARDAWLHQRFAREIDRGKRDRSIRLDLDTDAAAAMFAGTLRGLGLQWMVTPPTRHKKLRTQVVSVLRHSIAADS